VKEYSKDELLEIAYLSIQRARNIITDLFYKNNSWREDVKREDLIRLGH